MSKLKNRIAQYFDPLQPGPEPAKNKRKPALDVRFTPALGFLALLAFILVYAFVVSIAFNAGENYGKGSGYATKN